MSSWWESDPRYGQKGWTLNNPGNGRQPYFVKAPARKRRAPARALRFGTLEAGAVLIQRGVAKWDEHVDHPFPVANEDLRRVEKRWLGLAIVTDRWFDPVAGEDDPLKGQMAGLRRVNQYGLSGGKTAHTLRGLASQGYRYATPEQARLVSEFVAVMTVLVMDWKEGRASDAEARLRWPSFARLMASLEGEAAAA